MKIQADVHLDLQFHVGKLTFNFPSPKEITVPSFYTVSLANTRLPLIALLLVLKEVLQCVRLYLLSHHADEQALLFVHLKTKQSPHVRKERMMSVKCLCSISHVATV